MTDLLVEREAGYLDAMEKSRAEGRALTMEDWNALAEGNRSEFDRLITGLLGPDRFEHFLSFDTHLGSYAVLDKIETAARRDGAILDPDTAKTVLGFLTEDAESKGRAKRPGIRSGKFDPMDQMISQGVMSEAVVKRASQILSPTQLAALQAVRSDQIELAKSIPAMRPEADPKR